MNRWAKHGVLDQIVQRLQLEQIVRIRVEAFSLDSTSVKVHPDATGALKTGRRPPGARAEAEPPRFLRLPRMLERL